MLIPESKRARRPRSSRRVLLLVAAMAVLIGFASSATAAVIVTGKQIKDNTITSKDLRDGDLKGADFTNESLTQADFSSVVAGPVGPDGDRGAAGAPGTAGLSYQIERLDIPKNTTRSWAANCPAGTRVISGGGSNADVGELTESAPLDAGAGWLVGVRNKTNKTISGYAWALCVTAP